MKEFDSIKHLMENIKKISNDAFIFTSDACITEGITKGRFIVLEAEEEAELNDDNTDNVFGKDMRYLMEADTLKKLIDKTKTKNPGASTDELIKAVEQYLSSDEVIDDQINE